MNTSKMLNMVAIIVLVLVVSKGAAAAPAVPLLFNILNEPKQAEIPAVITHDQPVSSQSVYLPLVQSAGGPTGSGQDEYKLTITINGQGSVIASPAKTFYTQDQLVTLSVIAASGWKFVSWNGDLVGNANPATLVMQSHRAVTAQFTQNSSIPIPTNTTVLVATPIVPTNTPLSVPTDLPTATFTPTFTPIATNTSIPPTNTTLPPTNTPVPPTNTPVPPTNTLTPTPTNTPAQPSCNTITQIPLLECKALEALYNSTDQVGETDNWFTTNSPCDTWAGIVCRNNHVAELLLDDWYIHGTIAPELGNLTQLEILDLADNFALAGTVPPELGKLSNLRILRLDRNSLTGGVPIELSNLAKIEELSLYTNQLDGILPVVLSTLQNVRLFWFYDTGLCTPPDEQFQHWLNSIAEVHGNGICNTSPSIPASVQAVALSSTEIQIIWVDTSYNENQFTINEGSTSFTIPANRTSFVHRELAPNSYHCYSISATNDHGSSEWTEWSCTWTQP